MKNLLLVALLALSLASCKEAETPDPNSGNTNSGIVGDWTFSNYEQTNGIMKLDGVPFGTFSGTSSNESGTYKMDADGKVNTTVGYTWTLTMNIGGTPQTQTQVISPTTTSGDYTYDANTKELTLIQGGNTIVADVLELTSSKLVFTYFYEQSQTSNGITSYTGMDNTITLTR